jgi:hypothetical protein
VLFGRGYPAFSGPLVDAQACNIGQHRKRGLELAEQLPIGNSEDSRSAT